MRSLCAILREAAELCDKGWLKGHYVEHSGRAEEKRFSIDVEAADAVAFCPTAAIWRASGFSWQVHEAAGKLALRVTGFDTWTEYNDQPGRTKTESVNALRDAAVLAEAEGL